MPPSNTGSSKIEVGYFSLFQIKQKIALKLRSSFYLHCILLVYAGLFVWGFFAIWICICLVILTTEEKRRPKCDYKLVKICH